MFCGTQFGENQAKLSLQLQFSKTVIWGFGRMTIKQKYGFKIMIFLKFRGKVMEVTTPPKECWWSTLALYRKNREETQSSSQHQASALTQHSKEAKRRCLKLPKPAACSARKIPSN